MNPTCIDCGERPPFSAKAKRCKVCHARHAATTRGRQYAQDSASCHRERKAFGESHLCRWCFEARISPSRLRDDPLPALVDGVAQFAGPDVPPACPHCGAWWDDRLDYVVCWRCGRTWHRTSTTRIGAPENTPEAEEALRELLGSGVAWRATRARRVAESSARSARVG